MARRQHEPLRPVSDAERRALTAISKATSERVDRVRRARAVLTVAETGSFAEAARQAGFCSVTAVTNLVQRFNQRGLDALTIAAGRGRRPTYGLTARAQIVQVAQTPPDRRADQTATWSLATLRRRLRREGLTSVGTSTIRRVLHEAGGSYQRTRTWCPTGTAQRVRTSGVVIVVDPETEGKKG
jgi:transposase